MASYLDVEYNSMRRRMSRVRVQQSKTSFPDADGEDEPDEYYRDLIKYWKKHGIPLKKDILVHKEEIKAQEAAKRKGRRKSRELEDLGLNTMTGKLKPMKKKNVIRTISNPSLGKIDEDGRSTITRNGLNKVKKSTTSHTSDKETRKPMLRGGSIPQVMSKNRNPSSSPSTEKKILSHSISTNS
ncbi:hypothetical protein CHS0354_025662 [Potamilus streckersoni]|uniref:Uncharacterized protein n=1 Tax=Potamilus streckersoni TaxID=2493646 RepID=A0AAE0RZ92_9BIVA|nr:hypothetical protein CHS0354_025662 [Potamilus streckersoni]